MGSVALVGAGPGDPGLLTVRGRERLEAADAVVYDRLVAPELVALAPPSARRVHTGKARDHQTMSQDAINNLLVLLAAEGRAVVRLKGGDPFLFGRGGEEAAALKRAGIPFEVVPGITSAVAVPAYAGIPVTDRRAASGVTFVTGHLHPNDPRSRVDWGSLGAGDQTVVILMGMLHLGAIAASLIEGGRPAQTPTAAISWGTTEQQATVTAPLAAIAERAAEAGVGAPAIVVVGEVVALRESLAWFAEAAPDLIAAAV
jgi:uroporphyrinogen III methyltransferase/synthase